MISKTGAYSYGKDYFSIDPTFQPDSLQFIIKLNHGQRYSVYNAMPLPNLMGLLPLISIFTGSVRVYKTVKTIFKELSSSKNQSNHDTSVRWNALKNLIRGIFETTPLTGIILIIFESVRNIRYATRVAKEIENSKNIAAIAINGKLIAKIDLKVFDAYLKNIHHKSQDELDDLNRLMCFKGFCDEFLKTASQKASEHNKLVPLNKILTMIPSFLETQLNQKNPIHNT